ncbi:hypothetical protein ENBRE01_3428 [Enteropsectra breve]|nr:hypothetical protein ENBRE01_3428 [Enteropsectra breve]
MLFQAHTFVGASIDDCKIDIYYASKYKYRVRADLQELILREKIVDDLRLNHNTDFYEETLTYQEKSNTELTVHIEFKSEDARKKVGCLFKNKLSGQFSL